MESTTPFSQTSGHEWQDILTLPSTSHWANHEQYNGHQGTETTSSDVPELKHQVAKSIRQFRQAKPYTRNTPTGLRQYPIGLSAPVSPHAHQSPQSPVIDDGQELLRLKIDDNLRHLVLRRYKGVLYICTRDYFCPDPTQAGTLLATKRGINLTVNQYLTMKSCLSVLDTHLQSLGVHQPEMKAETQS